MNNAVSLLIGSALAVPAAILGSAATALDPGPTTGPACAEALDRVAHVHSRYQPGIVGHVGPLVQDAYTTGLDDRSPRQLATDTVIVLDRAFTLDRRFASALADARVACGGAR